MITIQNLQFGYSRKQELFSNFNMELKQGSIVGLLGKNGAGKSTLLKLIAGLIFPKNGEVKVNDYHSCKRNPSYLTDVFMVPEEFKFPSVSINHYAKTTAPFYEKFDLEKLKKLLVEFELDGASNLNKLSHGQRKKFLIAFALATNCSLLLLDEPTNGLDIPSKSLFRKILVSSVDENQLVVISTHQVKDIENIIDQIVIVDNGKLFLKRSIDEITSKYRFETQSSIEHITDAIYTEKSLGGYRLMRPIGDNDETDIDIELLFNAIIHNNFKFKDNE